MITVIGSLKGGSGKSTIVFNLGVWLAMAEAEVVLCDLDPQQTLRDVADIRAEEGYKPRIRVESSAALDDLVRQKKGKRKGELLLDVGTSDMEAFGKAIAVADRVVIPVPPSQADIWSTQRFLRWVGELASGGALPDIFAFVNRADTHHAITETDETAAALIALPGVRLLKRRLGQRTAYRRSFSEGLAVFEMDPRSKAAHEFVALAAALYPMHTR